MDNLIQKRHFELALEVTIKNVISEAHLDPSLEKRIAALLDKISKVKSLANSKRLTALVLSMIQEILNRVDWSNKVGSKGALGLVVLKTSLFFFNQPFLSGLDQMHFREAGERVISSVEKPRKFPYSLFKNAVFISPEYDLYKAKFAKFSITPLKAEESVGVSLPFILLYPCLLISAFLLHLRLHPETPFYPFYRFDEEHNFGNFSNVEGGL